MPLSTLGASDGDGLARGVGERESSDSTPDTTDLFRCRPQRLKMDDLCERTDGASETADSGRGKMLLFDEKRRGMGEAGDADDDDEGEGNASLGSLGRGRVELDVEPTLDPAEISLSLSPRLPSAPFAARRPPDPGGESLPPKTDDAAAVQLALRAIGGRFPAPPLPEPSSALHFRSRSSRSRYTRSAASSLPFLAIACIVSGLTRPDPLAATKAELGVRLRAGNPGLCGVAAGVSEAVARSSNVSPFAVAGRVGKGMVEVEFGGKGKVVGVGGRRGGRGEV